MKTSLILILLSFLFFGKTGTIYAQKSSISEEIKIKTSAVCKMCDTRIKENLSFERGVKDIRLDLETKILTVKYDSGKTDPDKIRKAISRIGYDADDVPADPKAYAKLPACCKKDGEDKSHN